MVRCDDGNAKHFMCTYHGWMYANDGTLEHVPGTSEAYYDELDRSKLGLVEARVETYAGIVFATWATDAPSLEAYLGDARWYLDTLFNRRDGGMQALGPMKWLEPVNWKTMVDNCSDNYHVPTTHQSSARVQTRYLGRPHLSHKDQFESPNRHVFVNGHSLTFREAPDNTPRYVHGMSKDTFAGIRWNGEIPGTSWGGRGKLNASTVGTSTKWMVRVLSVICTALSGTFTVQKRPFGKSTD